MEVEQKILCRYLQKYSCASRNGAVQMFFLTPDTNMFAGKFIRFFE